MVTPLESLKAKYMKDPDIIPEKGQDKEVIVTAMAEGQIRQRRNNERAFELLNKAGSGEIADPGGGSKEGGDAAMYRLTEFVNKPIEKNDLDGKQWGEPSKRHLQIMNRPFSILDKKDVDNIKLDTPPDPTSEAFKLEIEKIKSLSKLLENEGLRDRITEQDKELMTPFFRYIRDNDLEVDSEELSKINKDISTIVHKFKFFYNRPRPYQHSDIEEFNNVAARSPSYPSGHTTNSAVMAEILADTFPEHADNFRSMGREIGLNRVISGLHHPTDHIAGLKLADQIIPLLIDEKITKSDDFMTELFKYMEHRKELLKDMTQIGGQDILDGVRIEKAKISQKSDQKKRRKQYENKAEKLGLDIGNAQDQQDLQRETGMVIYGSPTEGKIFTPEEVEAEQQKVTAAMEAKQAKRGKQAIKEAKEAKKVAQIKRDDAQAKIDTDKKEQAKIERRETRQQKVSAMDSLNVDQSILNNIKNKFNRDFENVPDGKFKQDAEKHFTSPLVAALGKDKAFQQISTAKKLLDDSKKTPTKFNTFLDNVRKDIDPNYEPQKKQQEEIVEPDRNQKILDAWNYFQGEAQHHHKLEDETRAWGDLGDKANRDQKNKEKIITLNRDTKKRNIGLSNKKENYASDEISDSLDSKFPVKILDMLGYNPDTGHIPLLGKRLRNSIEENTDKRATLHRFGQDEWSERTMSKEEENNLIRAHELLAKNQTEKMTTEDVERNIGTYLKPPKTIKGKGVNLSEDFLDVIETFDNLSKEDQDIILNNLEKRILANDGVGLTPGDMNRFLKEHLQVTDRGKREIYEFPSSVNSVDDQITAKVDFILDRLWADPKYQKDLEQYKLPNSLGLENINTNKDPLQWQDPNPKSEAGEILAKINLINLYKEKSELTSQGQELSNTFTDPNNTFEDLKNNNDITQSRSELQQIMKLHGMSTAEQGYFFKRHLPTENASVNDYVYAAGQLRNLLNKSEQFATDKSSFKDLVDETYDMVDYKGKPEDIPVIEIPPVDESDTEVSDTGKSKAATEQSEAQAITEAKAEAQAIAEAKAKEEAQAAEEAKTKAEAQAAEEAKEETPAAEEAKTKKDTPEERLNRRKDIIKFTGHGFIDGESVSPEDAEKLGYTRIDTDENSPTYGNWVNDKDAPAEETTPTGETKILGGFEEFSGLQHVVVELPDGTKQHFGQQIEDGPFAPLKGFYLREVIDKDTGESKYRNHHANSYYQYNRSEADNLQGVASQLDKAFGEGQFSYDRGPVNRDNKKEVIDFNNRLNEIAGDDEFVPKSTWNVIDNPDLHGDKSAFKQNIFDNTPKVEPTVAPAAEEAKEKTPVAEQLPLNPEVVPEAKVTPQEPIDERQAIINQADEAGLLDHYHEELEGHGPDNPFHSKEATVAKLLRTKKTPEDLNEEFGKAHKKFNKFKETQEAAAVKEAKKQQPPPTTLPPVEEGVRREIPPENISTPEDVAKNIAQRIADMPTLFDPDGNPTSIANNQSMSSRYRQLRKLHVGDPVAENGEGYVKENGVAITRKDVDFAMRNVAPDVYRNVQNQLTGLKRHLPKGIQNKLQSEHTEGHENFQADYHGPEHKEKVTAEKQQSQANEQQLNTAMNEVTKQGMKHDLFNSDQHKKSHELTAWTDNDETAHNEYMDNKYGAGEWSKSHDVQERREKGLPPPRPASVPATHLWHANSSHWVTPDYMKEHPDIGAGLTHGEVATGFENRKDSSGNAFAIPHDAEAAKLGIAGIHTTTEGQGTGGSNIILTNANTPKNEHNHNSYENVNEYADEKTAAQSAQQAHYVEDYKKNAQSKATDSSRGLTRYSSGGNTALERYGSRFKAAGGFEGALARFKAAVLPDFAGGGFTQEQATKYSAPDYEKE